MKPYPFVFRSRSIHGSTVVIVLGFIVLVSMVFSAVLSRVMNMRKQVSHIASWQEALLAAEGSSETAMAEFRKSLFDANAFAGWEKLKPNGAPDGTVPAGTGRIVLERLKDGNGLRYVPPPVTHLGEGNTRMDMEVIVDAPPEMVDASRRQWFRIRAYGTTYLPGASWLAGDGRDSDLRRMSFVYNRKLKKSADRPQTTRMVELLVKPASLEPAIFSREPIDMNNSNILVDAYDSRDSTTSTNGLYDPSKRIADDGDIATNSQMIDAGGASIYGDAYTNGGTVTGANFPTGGEHIDEYELNVASVGVPKWQEEGLLYITVPPSGMSGGSTVVGGTKDNPARYKIGGTGAMNITGGDLTFLPNPVELAAGRESYVEVWAPGDMKTAGTGGIALPRDPGKPGVYVKIFVEGSIYIGGNGNWNANSQPERLQVMGVKYLGTGTVPAVTIAGNGIIVAAIYTPDHNVEFKASGSGGQMWGSIFGKSIVMGGSTAIHYDRALADIGYITDYRIKNWFEDSK